MQIMQMTQTSRTSGTRLFVLVSLVLLGGCSQTTRGAARTVPGPVVVNPALAVSNVTLIPCPDLGVQIELVATTAIGSPRDVEALNIHECIEGRFPAPGWAIIADTKPLEYAGVFDARTREPIAVRSAERGGAISAEEYYESITLDMFEVVDLDGDQVDELVHVWSDISENSASQSLSIDRVATGKLTEVLGQQIGWANRTEGWGCRASVRILDPGADGKRRIAVAIESDFTGMGGGDCSGAVFELSGTEVTDVSPEQGLDDAQDNSEYTDTGDFDSGDGNDDSADGEDDSEDISADQGDQDEGEDEGADDDSSQGDEGEGE